MSWAVEAGLLRENPCVGVKTPPVRNMEREIFTQDEVKQLIAFQRSQWMADVIEIAYRTGMRRGEIFGLRWSDVDFSSRKLLVHRQVSAMQHGQRLEGPPKTNTSRRTIYLDNRTIELLERRRAATLTDYVIESEHGGLPSPWTAAQRMNYSCKRLEIKLRGLHCLRHTHATMLLEAGVNPKVVQERLGHASLEMTLGVYGHVLPSMQQTALEALERIT